MASTIHICGTKAPSSQSPAARGVQHSSHKYLPSLWGDFFLTHQPCTQSEFVAMKDKAHIMEEEVRRIMMDVGASKDLVRKLELIDTLERLGLGYHYKKEIDEVLCVIYNDMNESSDLYVTSLRFYLLRKHGYAVSSDVFVKFFRDGKGNILGDDANTILMVYDAAHLRTHGEDILDHIITLCKIRLQSALKTKSEATLVEEVRLTLETPRFRRVERVEARHFISLYQKNVAQNDTILEFAKLDYNIVQVLYCKELKELTVWWIDLKSHVDVQFARDRMVEMYFWMMAIVYEPYYTYSRIIVTKLVIILALLDDVFGNYTTTEESAIFCTAIERWDDKATGQLPANQQEFLKTVIDTTNKIVKELQIHNNKNAEIVKKLVINTAKCYHSEVKWRDEHYVPTDVEEHLQISMPSIAAMPTITLTFISLGDVASREAIEWAFTFPKIIKGVSILARISNDIMSHEREQASGHMASTVQTCMKQYEVTVEEAIEKLRVLIEKAWMDIVQECLDPEHSVVLLEKVVAFAQSIDFMYKHEDRYTLSSNLKDTLTSLYVKFV
ncbi:hypothetical protein QOZ80_8AG0633700 [Eleusine coracana subsp. coracana]|nr:hypothetical protein QOZ80_8AG0633700 [Eleusine coracana subsp. coracana]